MKKYEVDLKLAGMTEAHFPAIGKNEDTVRRRVEKEYPRREIFIEEIG